MFCFLLYSNSVQDTIEVMLLSSSMATLQWNSSAIEIPFYIKILMGYRSCSYMKNGPLVETHNMREMMQGTSFNISRWMGGFQLLTDSQFGIFLMQIPSELPPIWDHISSQ